MNTDDSQRASSIPRAFAWFAAIGLLAFGVVGSIVSLRSQPKPAIVLDRSDRLSLVEKKNVAVASLQAGSYDEAIRLFTELSDEVPGDPLGPRNLAIARVLDLPYSSRDPSITPESKRAPTLAAIERLNRIPGQEAIAWRLEAEVARETGDLERAVTCLKNASQLTPDDLTIWTKLAELYGDFPSVENERLELEARKLVARLAPESYGAHLDLFQVQSLRQDLEIAETLERIRPWMSFLREPVFAAHKHDLEAEHSRAVEHFKTGDWRRLRVAVLRIGNLTKPLPSTYTDRRRMYSSLEDWAIDEFAPSLNCRPSLDDRNGEVFARFKARRIEIPNLSSGVRDVRVTDFDLDGRDDLVVLNAGEVSVYHRTSNEAAWELLASHEAPTGMARVLPSDWFASSNARSPSKLVSLHVRAIPDDGNGPMAMQAPLGSPEYEEWLGAGGQTTFQGLLLYGSGGASVLTYDPLYRSFSSALGLVEQAEEFNKQSSIDAACPLDFDSDGDLDLAFATGGELALWRNRGDATFSRSPLEISPTHSNSTAAALLSVDLDRDSDADLLVADSRGGIYWLDNMLFGRFERREVVGGMARVIPRHKSLAIGDFECDGGLDIVAAGEHGVSVFPLGPPNAKAPTIETMSRFGDSSAHHRSLAVFDYDNDAIPDLATIGEGRLHLFRRDGVVWKSRDDLLEDAPSQVMAFDFGDLDGDGDLDIVCLANDSLTLLENDGGNRNHWLDVHLIAPDSFRFGPVNHYGLGSVVELRRGTRRQVVPGDRQTLHFGLGASPAIDSLHVRWTSGYVDGSPHPQADRLLRQILPYH